MKRVFSSTRMKLKVGIAVVLTGMAATVVGWNLIHREAYYQSKPTSYWVGKARAGDSSQNIIAALETLGPEAVLPLLKAVVRKDSLLEHHYSRIYGSLPALAQKLLPQPQPGQQVRDNCYMMLNRLSVNGPKAKLLVPELIKLVRCDDGRPSGVFVDANTHQALPHGILVRAVAADMLADIGPEAAAAVPALVERLRAPRSKQDHFCDRFSRALGYIGPAAKDAIPALTELLHVEDITTALWAGEAIWKIDPTQAGIVEPIVDKGLRQTNALARIKAARVHWKIKRDVSIVMPVLVQLMREKENLWMVDTMRALEEIGLRAEEAIPALTDKLVDPEPAIRKVAAEARAKIEAVQHGPDQ